MNTTWIWAIVAILIIGLGAWWFMSSAPIPATQEQTNNATSTGSLTGTVEAPNDAGMQDDGVTVDAGVTVTAPKTVTVTYNGSAFSPATVAVNRGDTVNFVNQSGGNLWVAADEHPAHTEYDSTARTVHCASGYAGATPFDQCQNGSSYSFTFTKAGTFDYHNHSAAQAGGSVIVR